MVAPLQFLFVHPTKNLIHKRLAILAPHATTTYTFLIGDFSTNDREVGYGGEIACVPRERARAEANGKVVKGETARIGLRASAGECHVAGGKQPCASGV